MFTMRTAKPGAGNKCYIRQATGGWNSCIQGSPTDSQCNVLANCVGYANGRFNEIYNEITGNRSNKYNTLNCNAENFIERARNAGLEVGQSPRAGAIMCWQKGATLSGNDGAGHVAIVERVNSDGSVYTSESGYGSSAFWNQTRYNSNGRWGIGSGYTFRGFIYNPAVKETQPTPQPAPQDNSNGYTGKFKVGDRVVVSGPLYVSSKAASPSGSVSNKETTITRVSENAAHPYNTTGDLGWMNESNIKLVSNPTPTPAPSSNELKVGDKVKIIGTGNGSSYGDSNTAGGIGWEREILKIWNGRPFPYQVGNSTATTGFYKASSLEKIIR